MRTFIAVEIPDRVKKVVEDYINSIKDSFNDVKWVSPENLHLTVKFLGEVKESDVKKMSECIEEVTSNFSPFVMGLSGVGFFPSLKNLRVIWIGADGGADSLLDLFHELEHCLEILGFDREARTFSPHLTIGRVKKMKKTSITESLPEFNTVDFDVSGIKIIKSTLTPQGPVYEKLFESKLEKHLI